MCIPAELGAAYIVTVLTLELLGSADGIIDSRIHLTTFALPTKKPP